MVTVRLYGHLAERFGAEHAFAIGSTGEAILALEANYPGFRRAFLEGQVYYLRSDDHFLASAEETFMPVSRRVDIVPDVEGRGLEVLVAAGLTALAPTVFAAGTLATSITASLIVAVVTTGLMIGLSLLLAPKPQKDVKGDKKEDSFLFSGADATIGQGAPVPLIYGRVWVPPTVISAGLETGDEEIED